MDIQRIAAFSVDGKGGNPAGVVLIDSPLSDELMLDVAAEVGFSETAFAQPLNAARDHFRVRYFSPESEVPFCGHATIALGAALGQEAGEGRYRLQLNEAEISVEVTEKDGSFEATLQSPRTRSRSATDAEIADAMALFGLRSSDLDARLPPARIHGGSDHVLLAVAERETLSSMHYDLDAGREMMRRHGLVTIMLVHVRSPNEFDVRNAFASGGVLEDPATGAAAAAFAGYLRDIGWEHGGRITLNQGQDMGAPSLIVVELDDTPAAPVSVSGSTRAL